MTIQRFVALFRDCLGFDVQVVFWAGDRTVYLRAKELP